MAFNIGDKVECLVATDYYGTSLARFVLSTVFDVLEVSSSGERVVIGLNGVVTAAMRDSDLRLEKPVANTPSTPEVPVAKPNPDTGTTDDSTGNGLSIDEFLTQLYYSDSLTNENYLKYNMRLFGLPHQHSKQTDCRAYSPELKVDDSGDTLIGRKFIENIMLEAPVITIIPGKPLYMPGTVDQMTITDSLVFAASGNLAPLQNKLTNRAETTAVRYYDFQQDYYTYMKYVNLLCSVSAGLLELETHELDGKPLTQYDWKNYRWNASSYNLASANLLEAAGNVVGGFVDLVKSYGNELVDFITGNDGSSGTEITGIYDNETDDPSYIQVLEQLLTQTNFIQFYVDPSSGVNESNDNNTAASGLSSFADGLTSNMKEFAFIAGGLGQGADWEALSEAAGSGIDDYSSAVATYLGSSGIPLTNSVSGMLDRIGYMGGNIIKGDNMVFPDIYQSSSYSKSYSVTVNLKNPYGNRLSYFLNVLVPLFHMMALAIPKQSTANSYAAPFIIKAYFPGVFSCNLGIVQSISVEKNSVSSTGWTMDGFPTDIRVTLNIIDLYSDLSMSPAGDINLFLSNSSLIEYIATNCGVNLVTPQLENRVTYFLTAIKSGFSIIDDEINMAIFGQLEDYIASITGV